MNRIEPDHMVACYKIILADEWRDLSESERKNYIRRMMLAKYGAFTDKEMFPVVQKVEDTDIYKYAEREGLTDEPKDLYMSKSYEHTYDRLPKLRWLLFSHR